MPFVSDGRILIGRAFEQRYAMPAFNIFTLEMAQACVEAAELERAPIILQTSPGDLLHTTPKNVAGMVRAITEDASVPVMLHLDHGDSLERVGQSLRAGYSSAMFDAESHPLEENIRLTREVAATVHACNMSLEAAGGSFGGGEGGDATVTLTEPEVAARLLQEGQADMVACSVGSVHGQSTRLDLDRLSAIAEEAGGPLVLHGGSGIAAEDLAEATRLGVVKVNIGAGLIRAVLGAWRGDAGDAPDAYTEITDRYLAVKAALIEVARDKIRIMGAAGKA
jgi:ketose-bisphosphate aldolase